MKKSYKQLNKEAESNGYGTFEEQLLQNTFSGKEKDVEVLLSSASNRAAKLVLLDLIDTLGEGGEWHSNEQLAQIAKLATKIVENYL